MVKIFTIIKKQGVLPSLKVKIMGNALIFIEKQVYKNVTHFGGQIPKDFEVFLRRYPSPLHRGFDRVKHKTTQQIYSLIRDRIVDMAIEESKPFVGDIKVDESYFGPRRVRGKRGRGASGKIPVLGLHKRQGWVFLRVVKNCSKAELMPIIQGRVVEGCDVYTNGWKAYDGLVTNGYQHHRVHHHENEFARGKIMLMASNLFKVMRSFVWQNFAECGRKNSSFLLKNQSGVSTIVVITLTQIC